MSSDASVELRLRLPEAKGMARRAFFRAVRDTFEKDIVPEAKRESPVGELWPSIPQQRGEKRIDHGTNRRSIDCEVRDIGGNRIEAEAFTQSGYGGYLEIGTRYMQPRPYLYPSFMRAVKGIYARIQRYVKEA